MYIRYNSNGYPKFLLRNTLKTIELAKRSNPDARRALIGGSFTVFKYLFISKEINKKKGIKDYDHFRSDERRVAKPGVIKLASYGKGESRMQ